MTLSLLFAHRNFNWQSTNIRNVYFSSLESQHKKYLEKDLASLGVTTWCSKVQGEMSSAFLLTELP
ncbi:unnamed protein product, partial [Ceratitis capitata]